MAAAPLINVETLVNNQVASTEGSTDNLILVAADSCGLLGTAQSAVDEAAAGAANAADVAINKTIESVGNLSKKVSQFASESASSAKVKLDETIEKVNAKIQELFDDAEDNPEDPDKQSALDNFLATIKPITDAIGAAFEAVKAFAEGAAASVNSFLFGDPDDEDDKGFINDVLNIANDARIMACNGANAALSAVGGGLGGAFNSIAESLSEDKSPQDIIKERNSAPVKAKSDAAKANADATNNQAENVSAGVDTVDASLDQLQAITAE